MSTDTEDAGFLSRWSRRKALVRQGASPPEPSAVAPAASPADAATQAMAAGTGQGPAGPAHPAAGPPVPAAPEPPPPTLDDVAALDRHSDYSRFVGRDVRPEVRNAALGKLFSDPHFNIMDGLDTYIDDYGKPDPLPQSMLRKMAQARSLGLFDDEDPDPPTAHPAQPAVAAPAPPEPAADENTDLQLQPDDGPGCTGAEPGPGEDAGRAH